MTVDSDSVSRALSGSPDEDAASEPTQPQDVEVTTRCLVREQRAILDQLVESQRAVLSKIQVAPTQPSAAPQPVSGIGALHKSMVHSEQSLRAMATNLQDAAEKFVGNLEQQLGTMISGISGVNPEAPTPVPAPPPCAEEEDQ